MAKNLIYFLLDAARMEDEMVEARRLNPTHISLYRGEPVEALASVAPYLFGSNRGDEFEQWFFEKGWSDNWGVIVCSGEEMKYLHKHFRRFLMIRTEDDEQLYFRFYDPRVLRSFLPTCDRGQLKEFFGPVDYFLCECPDPAYGIICSLNNKELLIEKVSKEEIMRFDPSGRKKRFSFF